MLRFDRKKKMILAASALLLVCAILLPILITARCTQEGRLDATTTGSAGTTSVLAEDEPAAVSVSAEDFDQKANFDALTEDRPLAYPSCPGSVQLYVASDPGKPASPQPVAMRVTAATQTAAAREEYLAARIVLPPIITIKPSIFLPTPTPRPSSAVTVLDPAAGAQLTAGDPFTLHWTVDSGRNPLIDILFSADGGQTYTELAKGIPFTTSFSLTVPDQVSDTCRFRINAWAGTVPLGYNLSPVFSIVPRPTPTPVPSPTPAPTLTPTPSVAADLHYGRDFDAFVAADGDPTRWFLMDVQVEGASRIRWQASRIPFSCTPDADPLNPPGLLVDGELEGASREFAIDFGAIMNHFSLPASGSPGGAEKVNHGTDFRNVAGKLVLPEQKQRLFYIRAIALDGQGKAIGKPGDGVAVTFGTLGLDLSLMGLSSLPDVPPPILSYALPEKGYEENPSGSMAIPSGSPQLRVLMSKTPIDSVEIDFQVATEPFKTATQADYSDPAGLVYRSVEKNMVYTTVTRYYQIPFQDFAPTAEALGKNTVRYYVRAVCYQPGAVPGTAWPVVTKTGVILYTGDPMTLIAENLESAVSLPTEQVTVKSYMPNVEFLRYIPVQWESPNSGDYFEVTRPIQAEEICFSIRNNKTGDFLLPYGMHMDQYPGTTREQYQAVVDRMLPVGASFHLTITQSAWDAFWGEFFGLLGEIYGAIRGAYNGIKESVAVFVADRFEFLGPTAQGWIKSAVETLINTGLAAVGLPPTLPNFEMLASAGIDYCLEAALMEIGVTLGVPVDQIPEDVRDQVTGELTAQMDILKRMNHVNPLDVDYLRPSTEAMYRPAYVDVQVSNYTGKASPTGTLTVNFYSVKRTSVNFYDYVKLPIPALQNGDSTFIRVFLKEDIDGQTTYDSYYWGKDGDCLFTATAVFNLPDVEQAAKEQGLVGGDNPLLEDTYVFDKTGVYAFSAISPPCNDIFPQYGTVTN